MSKLVTAIVLLLAAHLCAATTSRSAGLYRFFDKLEKGQQVTVAAIGGSITMRRSGWARKTVDKIREAYPENEIRFVNAGVSGSGSNLAVFRLQRDVIAHRPDLVFIEFVINDGGAPDAACVRNLESIVVGLKQCPQTPAIVFVQCAHRMGANRRRHARVAAHYNLMSVDMQAAVRELMQDRDLQWDDLFGDDVHPNERGHALYARELWQRLKPYATPAEEGRKTPPLPKPLASEGLVLDGRLISPGYEMSGWSYDAESGNGWWLRFFEGSLQSDQTAGTFHLPFYGRTIGLWLLVKHGRGRVRVVVDGELLKEVRAFRPSWYYQHYVHNNLLDDRWHVLSLIPIGVNDKPPIVRIGYLLASDQTQAPEPTPEFWQTTWTQSRAQAADVAGMRWRVLPVTNWQVIGPFGGEAAKPWLDPAEDLDRDFGVQMREHPELGRELSGRDGKSVGWQTGQGENGWVDLDEMYGLDDRGVAYAYAQLHAARAGMYTLRLSADYFTRLHVNGKHVHTMLSLHGSKHSPMSIPVDLQRGDNDVWLKIHAGSKGFGFRLEYPADADLRAGN